MGTEYYHTLIEKGGKVIGYGNVITENDWQIIGHENGLAIRPPEKKWIGYKTIPFPHPTFVRMPPNTEATGGDENGGHRLVEPDHETALALADAPRSLRNYVAALQAENERLLAERGALSATKEDAERYRWLRHNNGYSIFSNIFGDVEMHNFRDKDLDVAIDDQLENLAIRKSEG
jgi:uncharacterized small protein (DUF1192 family)